MKGLLVKDLKLMKVQKSFFILIIVVAIGMMVGYGETILLPGFLSFVMLMFVLSTISYDEFDNGNAFLFTLPVSRKGYVAEKYALSLLLGGGSWVIATLIAVVFSVVKGAAGIADIVVSSAMILPIMLIIQAVMIPFQLKFGGEKARIAMIGAFGLLCLVGILIKKVAEMMGFYIWEILDDLSMMGMGMLLSVAIAIAVAILLVSVRISISIMKRKEF